MFCKNCGAKMPDDFEFCGKCGHPANEEPKSTKPTVATKKPKKRTGLIVAVVILSVLLAISAALFAFLYFSILPKIQDGSLFSGFENTLKDVVGEQMEGMIEEGGSQNPNTQEGMLEPSTDEPEGQEGEAENQDTDIEALDAAFLIGNWRETGLLIDPWGHVSDDGAQFAQTQIEEVQSYRGTYENYESGLIFYEDGTFVTIQYENKEPFAYRWYWWDITESNELIVGTGDEFPRSEIPNWSPTQLDLMQDFQEGDYSAFVDSPYWLEHVDRYGNNLYWYLPSPDEDLDQEVVCSVIERTLD